MSLTAFPTTALADGVIRCVPGEDHTNGFFVSCFIKKDSSSDSGIQKRKRRAVNDGDVTDDEDEEVADLEGHEATVEAAASSGTSATSNKKKKKNKRKKQKKVL